MDLSLIAVVFVIVAGVAGEEMAKAKGIPLIGWIAFFLALSIQFAAYFITLGIMA